MNRRNYNLPPEAEPDPLDVSLAQYLLSLNDMARHADSQLPQWARKALARIHDGVEAHVAQMSTAPAIKNSGSHVSSTAQPWNYDMQSCPVGAKVWLLNLSGVATTGPLSENMRRFFAAWAPLPKRDKEEEKRRGLHL